MHEHHGHAEEPETARQLTAALGLTALVLLVEVAGAWRSGSMALAADAAHVLGDVLALGSAAWAANLALRPPTARRTYGFGRTGILVALLNTVVLMVISLGIAVLALLRIGHPPAIRTLWMLFPAIVGLGINSLIAWRLHAASERDLNVRSAWLHVLGDAAASGAVILGALCIAWTGIRVVDPLLSLGISLALLRGGWQVLRRTAAVLQESSPEGLDTTQVAAAMAEVAGVHGVHHVHLWSIGGGRRAMSGHLVLGAISLPEGQRIARTVEADLRARFGIEHCTLQIEADEHCNACEPHEHRQGPARRARKRVAGS